MIIRVVTLCYLVLPSPSLTSLLTLQFNNSKFALPKACDRKCVHLLEIFCDPGCYKVPMDAMECSAAASLHCGTCGCRSNLPRSQGQYRAPWHPSSAALTLLTAPHGCRMGKACAVHCAVPCAAVQCWVVRVVGTISDRTAARLSRWLHSQWHCR